MESLNGTASVCFMDDLLDFASDIGEEGDDEERGDKNQESRKVMPSLKANGFQPYTDGSVPDLEELEWISNLDAFPPVESCFTILPHSSDDLPKQHSPVSVLENSSTSSNSNSAGSNNGSSSIIMNCCLSLHVPVKARSKVRHRLRQELKEKKVFWWSEENFKKIKTTMRVVKTGRQCLHCGSEKTPQWRAGPQGPKTLCNACGVRFKSGRLVPEYRPANSPTFSSQLHSNSHRKVLEMRKQKQMMGLVLPKPMDKG